MYRRRSARPPVRPHHGRDRGEPRRPLRHLARGTGRVRAASHSTRRPRAPNGAPRRSIPVEATGGRSQRHGPHGRTSAPGHDDGVPRQAPAGVRRRRHVTAGNSSGITDGAAALVLMSEARAHVGGSQPLARVVGWTLAPACDPEYGDRPRAGHAEGAGATGLSLADIDLIEINEAFAAQVLACERELKFDPTAERRRRGDRPRAPDRHERRPDPVDARLRDAARGAASGWRPCASAAVRAGGRARAAPD